MSIIRQFLSNDTIIETISMPLNRLGIGVEIFYFFVHFIVGMIHHRNLWKTENGMIIPSKMKCFLLSTKSFSLSLSLFLSLSLSLFPSFFLSFFLRQGRLAEEPPVVEQKEAVVTGHTCLLQRHSLLLPC